MGTEMTAKPDPNTVRPELSLVLNVQLKDTTQRHAANVLCVVLGATAMLHRKLVRMVQAAGTRLRNVH